MGAIIKISEFWLSYKEIRWTVDDVKSKKRTHVTLAVNNLTLARHSKKKKDVCWEEREEREESENKRMGDFWESHSKKDVWAAVSDLLLQIIPITTCKKQRR